MQLDNLWLYVVAVGLIFCSCLLFLRDQHKTALFFLFLSALLLRLFAAHLDPFLHTWDEQFHALVARNMMDDPFKPMLRKNPIVPYDYTTWCCNKVWLHKQPLFLWQMALSMKLFGISEFAIRYPSALLGAIMVLLVYRIALLLSKDKYLAFIAAVFMCFSHYQFEQISGYYGMDHNDVSFGFYVLASIWAYAEYTATKKMSWIILIGVFSGCAVLNKWLTGLLVYSGWGLNIILSIRNKDSRKEIIHLVMSVLICLVIFLPWQLYIFHAFPVEAGYEYAFNSKHIFEVVEEHSGNNWVYWNNFPKYFGEYTWYIVLPGLALLFLKKYRSKIGTALLTYFLVVFVFFSFIAKTKIDGYFFVVAPLGFICMSVAFTEFSSKVKIPSKVYVCLAVFVGLIIFDFKSTSLGHDANDSYRIAKISNTIIYKNVREYIPPNINVVCNMSIFSDPELMFYHNDINAYAYCFNEELLRSLAARRIRIAAFKDHDGYFISKWLQQYPYLYIVNKQLK